MLDGSEEVSISGGGSWRAREMASRRVVRASFMVYCLAVGWFSFSSRRNGR